MNAIVRDRVRPAPTTNRPPLTPIHLPGFKPLRGVPVYDGCVLGVDASYTAFGLAVLGAGHVKAWTMGNKTLTGPARLAWFYAEFAAVLAMYKPAAVCLEGYAFGARSHAHTIGELGGVVRLALYHANLPLLVAPPNVIKLFVTGSGGAEKSTLSKELFKRFGVDLASNDEVDATACALMGLEWCSPLLALPKAQKAAVGKCVAFGPKPLGITFF